MTHHFYSLLFLFTWESVHVFTMSHRITAMLELFGGTVIGQFKLVRDKEGKSPVTGTVITATPIFSIRKTEFSSFYLCVCVTRQYIQNTPFVVDYSFSHTSIISSS